MKLFSALFTSCIPILIIIRLSLALKRSDRFGSSVTAIFFLFVLTTPSNASPSSSSSSPVSFSNQLKQSKEDSSVAYSTNPDEEFNYGHTASEAPMVCPYHYPHSLESDIRKLDESSSSNDGDYLSVPPSYYPSSTKLRSSSAVMPHGPPPSSSWMSSLGFNRGWFLAGTSNHSWIAPMIILGFPLVFIPMVMLYWLALIQGARGKGGPQFFTISSRNNPA